MTEKRFGMAGVALAVLLVAGVVAVVWRISAPPGPGLGRAFVYTVDEPTSKATQIDAGYWEVARIKTGLKSIRTLATGRPDLILAAGDGMTWVSDGAGKALGGWAYTGEMRGMAVASNGIVFTAIGNHVEIRDAAWNLLAVAAPPGSNAVITSLAVSGDLLFVADAGARVVYKCDLAGKVLAAIGRHDTERDIPGFVVPSPWFDVAVAPDGLLRVANPGRYLVEAYTFGGDREFAWGRSAMSEEGFCGCCNPAHLAILPDGRIVTSEKGLRRVKLYDAHGNFAGVVAGSADLGEGPEPCAIAVDARGRILVAPPGDGIIRVFERRTER